MSPPLQLPPQLIGIIQRSIVNQGNLSRRIGVGMRVLVGLAAVGGPASVCDADIVVDGGGGAFEDAVEAVGVFTFGGVFGNDLQQCCDGCEVFVREVC